MRSHTCTCWNNHFQYCLCGNSLFSIGCISHAELLVTPWLRQKSVSTCFSLKSWSTETTPQAESPNQSSRNLYTRTRSHTHTKHHLVCDSIYENCGSIDYFRQLLCTLRAQGEACTIPLSLPTVIQQLLCEHNNIYLCWVMYVRLMWSTL